MAPPRPPTDSNRRMGITDLEDEHFEFGFEGGQRTGCTQAADAGADDHDVHRRGRCHC